MRTDVVLYKHQLSCLVVEVAPSYLKYDHVWITVAFMGVLFRLVVAVRPTVTILTIMVVSTVSGGFCLKFPNRNTESVDPRIKPVFQIFKSSVLILKKCFEG